MICYIFYSFKILIFYRYFL